MVFLLGDSGGAFKSLTGVFFVEKSRPSWDFFAAGSKPPRFLKLLLFAGEGRKKGIRYP